MDKQKLTRLALAGLLAGSFGLTACNKATSSETDEQATGIAAAKTLAEFESECDKLGGAFVPHSCNGNNECKGYSYDQEKGIFKHDCKGKSTCQGGSCVEPAAT